MFNKNFLFVTIFGLLFFMAATFTAQDKPSEKKADQTSMQMNKCMDKIASDEHMRGEMMTKMMDQTKGDSASMMKMCKTMMDDPEMHSMMKEMMGKMMGNMDGKMMGNMDGKMMPDSTKVMNESSHDAHHPKGK
ncbi:hypothetical protein BMS3Abin04_02875 [bacterium BMS3Abin04]|nr:hypothetical protein BMS3Abin04_02875 [bacterium BMS3Abin04]